MLQDKCCFFPHYCNVETPSLHIFVKTINNIHGKYITCFIQLLDDFESDKYFQGLKSRFENYFFEEPKETASYSNPISLQGLCDSTSKQNPSSGTTYVSKPSLQMLLFVLKQESCSDHPKRIMLHKKIFWLSHNMKLKYSK